MLTGSRSRSLCSMVCTACAYGLQEEPKCAGMVFIPAQNDAKHSLGPEFFGNIDRLDFPAVVIGYADCRNYCYPQAASNVVFHRVEIADVKAHVVREVVFPKCLLQPLVSGIILLGGDKRIPGDRVRVEQRLDSGCASGQ